VVRSAKRAAKKGEIRAAIEEMRLQLLPDPGDVRELKAHARAGMVKLSVEARDEKVRYAALEWLHEVAEKEAAERERLEKIQQQRPPRREGQEEIIAELRMLYAKALPGREPPPLVEVAADAPGEE